MIMRITLLMIAVSLIVASFFSGITRAEVTPEFDGGYIKTSSGKLIEMRSQHCRSNYRRIGYIKNLEGRTNNIDQSNLKGFIVQGPYNFAHVTLHPIRFGKLGLTYSTEMVWIFGNEIECRSKQVSNNSYYFQPRNKLDLGMYVLWVDTTAWVFRVFRTGHINSEISKVWNEFLNVLTKKDFQAAYKFYSNKARKEYNISFEKFKEMWGNKEAIKTVTNSRIIKIVQDGNEAEGLLDIHRSIHFIYENNSWFINER